MKYTLIQIDIFFWITVFDVIQSPKRPTLCQIGGGQDKGDFYFSKIYIFKKNLELKKLSQSIKKNFFDYIKNNHILI